MPTSTVNDLRILNAFRQAHGPSKVVNPNRDYGNCDSIALIKTAMATFGIDAVFQSPNVLPIANNQATYSVVLRDGHPVNLSHAELDEVINDLQHNSGFVLPDIAATGDETILFKANFLYAVMAKEMLARTDVDLYKHIGTYEAALDRLAMGIDVFSKRKGQVPVDQVGVLLGLSLKDVTVQPALPLGPYMYALRKHVVYAYGDEGDNFGVRAPFATILQGHSTIFTRGWGMNQHPRKYVIYTP
jgi:hypothetical protein